ncbi:hypothetical protein PCANC_06838 [Puccinia coronata f. sp. avenae]|uniref:Uncharacterized protein n=1 Tax=Puccinia coronata f. sp. avenae TaxID=200324 RepID=A0A2N5VVG0_9BASI|nr:hypothetical protein PCANC_06838 [Puccinia coronata f. sp. avenae]
MRWATGRHHHLHTLLGTLATFPRNSPEIPDQLEALVGHSFMANLPNQPEQFNPAIVLVHSAFIDIATLQLEWNDRMTKLLDKTPSQQGDEDLLIYWSQQVKQIKRAIDHGFFTEIPGVSIDNLHIILSGGDPPNLPLPLNEGSDDDNDDDEAHLADIENILSETMRADIMICNTGNDNQED